MREIKFRAWCETDNAIEMIYFGEQQCDNGLWFDAPKHISEYFSIMQYTGLKDKNGVGVYEGDILLVDESGRFGGLYNIAVEWVDWHDKNVIGGEKGHHWAFFGCVCLKAKEISNYNPSANTIFTRGFLTRKYGSCIELSDMTRNDSFSIEVIGNIHQNPELLK